MSAEPIEIPWREISADALQGVLEAFVMREGTDYGAREVDFADKVEALRRQVRDGRVRILFDPVTDSINLVTSEALFRRAGD